MNTKSNQSLKEITLAKHIGCGWGELEPCCHDFNGLDSFEYGREEWAIGADEEADEACKVYIQDSVWAFRASFILNCTGLPSAMEEAIENMQDSCEGANDAILALIKSTCGMDHFVRESLLADGRGHFLSPYDGEEVELKSESGETFYAYRIN
jgi:hypothetical protein